MTNHYLNEKWVYLSTHIGDTRPQWLTISWYGFRRLGFPSDIFALVPMKLPGIICFNHYDDVIMSDITSQFTSLTIVYSIVYSDADQRKHQSSASLAFVWGIHRGPVNSPHKWQLRGKCFHLMTSSCKPHTHCQYMTDNTYWLEHITTYGYILQVRLQDITIFYHWSKRPIFFNVSSLNMFQGTHIQMLQ